MKGTVSSDHLAMELGDASDRMIFPNPGMRVLSAVIQFLGVSIVAYCLSRRFDSQDFSLKGLKAFTWPRVCIFLVLLDSWLFVFTSGILIFGVGLESGAMTCALAIYICIAFYATSKVFIYFFLIEKVHIVWAPSIQTKRFRSPVYIICFVIVCLYAVIAVFAVIGRIHYFRADGVCVIGLATYATIPLLSYDLFVNLFLTSLFLWPIVKTGSVNSTLRRVAIRTLFAALVALTTSSVNILMLTLHHGMELGWVCLGSCGADVICNAVALFWVTERTAPPTLCGDDIKASVDEREPELELDDTTTKQSQSPRGQPSFIETSPPTTSWQAVEIEPAEGGYFVSHYQSRQHHNDSASNARVSFTMDSEWDISRSSHTKLNALKRSDSNRSQCTVDSLRFSHQTPEDREPQLEIQIITEELAVVDNEGDLRLCSKHSRSSTHDRHTRTSHPMDDPDRDSEIVYNWTL